MRYQFPRLTAGVLPLGVLGFVGLRWGMTLADLAVAGSGLLAIGSLLGMARLMRQNREALTAALLAEVAARESQELLADAAGVCFDLFSVYSPVFDESGTIVDLRFEFANERVSRSFNGEPQALVGRTLLSVTESDFAQFLVSKLGQVFTTGVPYDVEYFSQIQDAKGRWMRIHGERSGERIAVAGYDIHERRVAQDALAESKEMLMTSLGAIQVGVMLVGADGSVLNTNPAAISIHEREMRSIHGQEEPPTFQIFHPWGDQVDPAERPVEQALRGESVHGMELLLKWPDGRERWIRANAEPLWRPGQELPHATVCSFQDITIEIDQRRQLDAKLHEIAETNIEIEAQRYALEQANEKLSRLATTDGLTGLPNHRAFQERLEAEIAQAIETGLPLSVALIDVDLFKVFNDDFGHQAGDAVLRRVAIALESAGLGFVARYGGEEFVALLPGANVSEAFDAAELMRKAVASTQWEKSLVTASFGVSTLLPGMGREILIEEADRALYKSKKLGRNRTTHASESAVFLAA